MTTINVGLLGFGIVGAGVAQLLTEQHDRLLRRTGLDIRLRAIGCKNVDDARKAHPDVVVTDDALKVVSREDVDVVLELMGGYDLARTAIAGALKSGKSVVTANKAVLAAHGDELFKLAEEHRCWLRFEAAVGGAIPALRAMIQSFAGDELLAVHGILNGTCNYMLTQMIETRASFADALADAQAKGYAEADPSFDIDGIDTAHKASVLARLGFETALSHKDFEIVGIRNVDLWDMTEAARLGYAVKLIATLAREGDKLLAIVEPTLVPIRQPLAAVSGVTNSIQLTYKHAKDIVLTGPGAGRYPTASAVVGDVVDVARLLATAGRGNADASASLGHRLGSASPLPVTHGYRRAHYLRLNARNRPGVLADVTRVLGDSGISIETIEQRGKPTDAIVPVVIVTDVAPRDTVRVAVTKIEALDVIEGKTVVYGVL